MWAIAALKVLKAVLLLVVALGALTFLNKSVADEAAELVNIVGADPGNHYIHSLLVKLALVDNRKLEEISAGSFFYAALLLTEGIGLFLEKRWAEYFTIFVTASLIPLEIYELVKHISWAKIIILCLNAAVVWYLIVRVKAENLDKRRQSHQ